MKGVALVGLILMLTLTICCGQPPETMNLDNEGNLLPAIENIDGRNIVSKPHPVITVTTLPTMQSYDGTYTSEVHYMGWSKEVVTGETTLSSRLGYHFAEYAFITFDLSQIGAKGWPKVKKAELILHVSSYSDSYNGHDPLQIQQIPLTNEDYKVLGNCHQSVQGDYGPHGPITRTQVSPDGCQIPLADYLSAAFDSPGPTFDLQDTHSQTWGIDSQEFQKFLAEHQGQKVSFWVYIPDSCGYGCTNLSFYGPSSKFAPELKITR